jgi:hypothetical protein
MNEKIPFFPEFLKIESEEKCILFLTNIYIHKESEKAVKIYSYVIKSQYVVKNKEDLNLAISAHLKECLRYSKYLNTDILNFAVLDFITSLDKDDPEFINKIHYEYM